MIDHNIELSCENIQISLGLSECYFLIDTFHQVVVGLILCLKFRERSQSRDLEEDPILLRLIDNSFKESGTSLNQEGVLLELILMAQDVNVLRDDLVIYQDRELTHEIELSFYILLFLFFVFLLLEVLELFIGEFLNLLVTFLIVVLSLLFWLLDLSLFLRIDSQNFTSRVLIKHFQHYVSELYGVM